MFNQPGLGPFPADIWSVVARHSEPQDQARLRGVNRQIRSAVPDPIQQYQPAGAAPGAPPVSHSRTAAELLRTVTTQSAALSGDFDRAQRGQHVEGGRNWREIRSEAADESRRHEATLAAHRTTLTQLQAQADAARQAGVQLPHGQERDTASFAGILREADRRLDRMRILGRRRPPQREPVGGPLPQGWTWANGRAQPPQ
jgi:hypothetical protein